MPRILVSNDDGYLAPGSQLLVSILQNLGYDIVIASPKKQQTAKGASISSLEVKWETKKIDGIKYYLVEGTPNDAIELLTTQNEAPFDLAVSGINWGSNVGSLQYRSGTYCAAAAAIGVGLSQRAIALSWEVPKELWFKHDNTSDFINELISVPGEMAKNMINMAVENNLWNSEIISIALPNKHTEIYEFVKFAHTEPEAYNIKHHTVGDTFKYSGGIHPNPIDIDTDIGALNRGHIAITPARYYLGNMDVLEKMRASNSK